VVEMENPSGELLDEIKSIRAEITDISNNLSKVWFELLEIDNRTRDMDERVSFVESVYNKVKQPFNYIYNKVSSIVNK
jgi:archaellum component FlaC